MLGGDLRALRNLFLTREGRGVLLGQLVVLLCMAGGSLALQGAVFGSGELRDVVRGHLDAGVVRSLHGLLLLTPLLFVAAMGTQHLRGELYTATHVPALLAAPVSSRAIVVRAFVRSLFGWSLFGIAFVVPPALMLAGKMPWPASPGLVIGISAALVALLAPLLACQVLWRVAIVRWCSGAGPRRVLQAANVILFFAVSLALVFGFVRGRDIGSALAAWFRDRPDLPWLLAAPAALPAAAAGFAQDWPRLLSPLLLLACAVPPLLLAAALYRASYDVFCSSVAPGAARRGRSRRWPQAQLPSLLAKLRAETTRVGSNLAGYALLATVLVVLLAQGMARYDFEAKVPLSLRETFFLLSCWQGLSLLVASLSFLNVVGNEQKQIVLLATSPLPRRVVLHAKLVAVSLPFVAMLLVASICGPLVAGVAWTAVAGFLLTAPPIVLCLLGVILVVGTWPRFLRVHDDVPLANSMRSVVPVLVIGVAGVLTLVLQFEARKGLVACYYGHGVFAPHDGGTVAAWLAVAAWAAGLAVFAAGHRLALRNLERLLSAQD
ncbi:MAG TPA: hypothetical protein VFZ65_18240 [Planctomycetota bacterium]|nr:hypothetical protein [Planctomycetota bacterium]